MRVCSLQDVNANKRTRWNREDCVNKVIEIKEALKKTGNQTHASQQSGVPRSTLQYWLKREGKTGLSPIVEAFFESPDGLAFLHQLIIALQFTMHELGPCGIDLVSLVLNLSQLSAFVASSHGALYNQSIKMKDMIIQFEEIEKKRLASALSLKTLEKEHDLHNNVEINTNKIKVELDHTSEIESSLLFSTHKSITLLPNQEAIQISSPDLPSKKKCITACLDETFFHKICLVAIEPVSNFILLEQYDDKRDAVAWNKAMETAMEGLPVKIIQGTGDQGTGLVKYIKTELGAPHSSDLFHVQQDLTRGTAAPMRSKLKQAEAEYKESHNAVAKLTKIHESYAQSNRSPVAWSTLDSQMQYALAQQDTDLRHVDKIKQLQDDIKKAKQGLGHEYHPYNLETGAPQTAESVLEKMEKHLTIIKSAAIDAELSEKCTKLIDKGHKTIKNMFNTMLFFWLMVEQQLLSLGLSSEMKTLMEEFLVPSFYLEIAAKKAKTAAERKRIFKLSKELLAKLELLNGWCNLNQSTRDQLKIVAKDCANLFQRSSSCVEGRNGYLSLRHHSSHHISDKKLRVLTIIHNYFIKRPDGTTAAERFFEEKPTDLFAYLLDNLNLPARPAKPRKELKMAA